MAKYCLKCGTELDRQTGLCPKCSAIDPVKVTKEENETSEAPSKEENKTKKKNLIRWTSVVILAFLVLAGISVFSMALLGISNVPVASDIVCSLWGHDWGEWEMNKPSTCIDEGEETRRCNRSEWHTERRSLPLLDHTWSSWKTSQEPTCTAEGKEIRTCIKDGVNQEVRSISALGHDWKEATYDAPKTCSRCGAQEGEVKGYVGYLEGEYADGQVDLGYSMSTPYVLSQPLYLCIKFTMHYKIYDVEGRPYGTGHLYARDLSGEWFYVGSFPIDRDSVDVEQTIPFTFSSPITFDALTVNIQADDPNAGWSIQEEKYFDEAQVLLE